MYHVLNGFEWPRGSGKDNAPFLEGVLTPQRIGYSIAAGAANVCEVTLTVQDGHGDALAYPFILDVWLSDNSTGEGLTAHGTVAIAAKSGEGSDFAILTANKALRVQTKTTGTYVLEITDSDKTGFYVAAQLPFSGLPVVSRQLVTGDYGA